MPIFNGEFVKRCPKGYRKDKKTDQCVLIRPPTKFRVASGNFSSISTPPPDPDKPDDPSDQPSKDIITGSDVGRALAEVGAPSLFLYAMAIALGRYEGEINLSAVFRTARDILIRAGESFGEGLFPENIYQAIETTTRYNETFERSIRTRTGSLLTNRRGGIPATEEDTIVEMVTRADRSTTREIRTTIQEDQIEPAQAMIDDAAAARLEAQKKAIAEDFEMFAAAEKESAASLGRMKTGQQAAADIAAKQAEAAENQAEIELIDSVKKLIADAPDGDFDNPAVVEQLDKITTQQLQADAAAETPKQTQNSFLRTFQEVYKDVVSDTFEAARDLDFGLKLRLAKLTKRMPTEVSEALREAGATDEQIYNKMLEAEKDADFVGELNVNSDQYVKQMTDKLYEKFGYDPLTGEVKLTMTRGEGGGEIAENIQKQQAQIELSNTFKDDAGQLRPVVKQQDELEPGEVPRRPGAAAEEEEGLLGGNIDFIDKELGKLNTAYEENLNTVTDAINESQENTGRRKLTTKDIDAWAEERGSFEEELVNDMLERKTVVNETIESATEAIQTSMKNAIDSVTKGLKRTIDFVTGESTPIFDEYEATQALIAEYEALGGDVAAETAFFEELIESDGLLAESGVDAEAAALGADAAADAAIDAAIGGAVGGATGLAGWMAAGEQAITGVAVAAGEEGAIAAYAILGAAATEVAMGVAAGAIIGGAIYAGTEAYNLIIEKGNEKRMGEPLPPAWDTFMEAIGITPTLQTTDNPSGYAAFFYGGDTMDDLYFFDQLPEVMRMVISDNKSVQNIVVKSLQFRYEQSELYNSEYPFVMDFLREERPLVTRQFTTDLRKSISGEEPLKFLLKFIQPAVTTNHYIEHILINQPKFASVLPLILEQKEKIQMLLAQRYINQQQKYLTRQEQIANFKANQKDRTQLKELTKQIVDSRYTSGVFVQHHSGDLHRVNQLLHYLDNNEYGHFGFKYVHEDAIINVLESYNEQQVENAEKKMEEQSTQLTPQEAAIVGQSKEEYKQQVIAQQQIDDPNLTPQENAILGGASGAAAASGQTSGYIGNIPTPNTPTANVPVNV